MRHRPGSWALAFAVLPSLGGCYLLQAAGGQARIAADSQPLERVLAQDRIDEGTRRKLELVRELREFAVQQLDLPDGRSFRRYAELPRRYALWSVVATPELSVEPRRWCFPVAGCVAYRGYFDEARADAYAARLRGRGDDTSVGGVATYSTLGHFADPVLSTMLGWSDARLAGTVIHEMAHERVYVPGDSAFNEAFAVVVENAGLRLWLEGRGAATELAAVSLARDREADFSRLLRDTRARLASLYASGLPAAQQREQKQREFGRLKHDYAVLRQRWGGYAGYDAWFARTLNNAHLAAVATYQDCVPALTREFEAAGSFPAFHRRVEALAQGAPGSRRAFCERAPAQARARR